ncbi:hypothetical protein [Brucella oryzae]|uniref:hypothetical protein n=1 Tax=Brucella oryzae TaxID=335286 RepID=UPI0011B04A82|nr:hypothetical protein [Brucella oryzae]
MGAKDGFSLIRTEILHAIAFELKTRIVSGWNIANLQSGPADWQPPPGNGFSLYSMDARVKSPSTAECCKNAKMHELMLKDGLQTLFALIDIFSMNANIRAR